MNLKVLGISMLFCLTGVQAHATKARLSALGQDANGSLFIRDERNIFLNPAQINSIPNAVNFEAGTFDGANAGVLNTPKAEGGVAYHANNLGWAVQLGRVAQATEDMVTQTSNAVDYFDPQNSVQAILGGRGSVDWGVSVHHASSVDDTTGTDQPNYEARTVELRGGVEGDRYQAYGAFDLIHESDMQDATPGVDQKYDGNMSFKGGGAFALSERDSIGGFIRKSGYDFDDGAQKGEFEQTVLSVAYFNKFRQDETTLVYGSGGVLWYNGTTDFEGDLIDDVKTKQLSLPFAIGCEVTASSWLKLRGSVTQYVFIHNQENPASAAGHKLENNDSTVVTLGIGFTFDKFVIDATLEGSGSAGTGQFNGDHMFANLGATYAF